MAESSDRKRKKKSSTTQLKKTQETDSIGLKLDKTKPSPGICTQHSPSNEQTESIKKAKHTHTQSQTHWEGN